MELVRCPGTSNIITPIPTIKICPKCNEEVEIWSDESKGRCSKCGTLIFKEESASCIQWCPYVRQCVGEEKYKQLMEEGSLDEG